MVSEHEGSILSKKRNLGWCSDLERTAHDIGSEYFRDTRLTSSLLGFHGGVFQIDLDYRIGSRISGFKENLELQKKSEKGTNKMMRNILTHANPEWREQRFASARILDPKNQDKMKRRRAGLFTRIGIV